MAVPNHPSAEAFLRAHQGKFTAAELEGMEAIADAIAGRTKKTGQLTISMTKKQRDVAVRKWTKMLGLLIAGGMVGEVARQIED